MSTEHFSLYESHIKRQTDELEIFWRRLGGRPSFEGKRVLDFGSSIGCGAFDALERGAREVVGIEIDENLLAFARHRLACDYPQHSGALHFTSDPLESLAGEPFDQILSKDVFEHVQSEGGVAKVLRDMHAWLKPGGLAYLGWGPLYYSARGDHGLSKALLPFGKLHVPWAHLMVPEALLIARYNRAHGEHYTSVSDFGLNQLPYAEYERAVHESPLQVVSYRVNVTDHPARRPVAAAMRFLPGLRNYLTSTIYCVLRRRPD
jgi:SAM-dependent methyltransferase